MLVLIQVLIVAVGMDFRVFGDQAGLVSISISEGLAYLLLAIGMVEGARGFRRNVVQPIRIPVPLPMKLYMAWIVGAALLSFLLFKNTDGLHSLKDALAGLVLYCAVVCAATTRGRVRIIMRSVFCMLLLLSALGLLQYSFGGPFINPIAENAFSKVAMLGEGLVDRPVVGTFGTPNAFAVLFAPLLLLVVCSTAENGSPRRRLWWGVCLVAMTTTLVLTQAKAVLAIAALCLVAFLIVRRLRLQPSGRVMVVIAGAGTVLLVLALWGLTAWEDVLPSALSLGTMRVRVGLALEALNLLQSSGEIAFLGGGVQAYRDWVPSSFHVHNEYILQGLMWGVGGAILFAFVILDGLVRKAGPMWAPKIALLSVALILLVESAAGTQRQAVLFLVLALAHLNTDTSQPRGEGQPETRLVGG